MPARWRTPLLFGLLAAAAAAVFYGIAVDSDVYAPGSATLRHHVDLPAGITWGVLLRKFYSVIAFTLVGFCASPLFERRRRIPGATLLVAFFSTLIEIGQKLTAGSTEDLASNVFDVACGAFGGLIGAWLWNRIVREPTR